MFEHILLPIDGSALSEKAARSGVRLARTFGARVTAFHMKPNPDGFTAIRDGFEKTREDYEREAEARSRALLSYVSRTAKAAGVACDVVSATGDDPFREIIKVANANRCDLVVMGSHGRRGIEAVLMGSETRKVLTHSQIPVLVYR
jgi:nucleotide-binding universal stress UspA family protein